MFTEEGCITAGTANVRDRQRVGIRSQLAPEYIRVHTGEEDTEVRGGKHRRVAAALSARARAFLT